MNIEELALDRSKWQLVKFGDVAIKSKASVDRESTKLTRYIAGEHMGSEDLHLRSWGEVSDGYLGPAFTRRFSEGEILYGSRRTYLRKVAVASFDGITANTTFVIQANKELILSALLPFIMLSEGFAQHSIRNSKGSVNPYINWKDIANYEFLLPPPDQQGELAKLLWLSDQAIQSSKSLSFALSRNKLSLFKENFSDSTQPKIAFANLFNLNPSRRKGLSGDIAVSFVTMSDVSDSGEITNSEIKSYAEVSKGFTYFEDHDILFAKITPCMENGKGALASGLAGGIGFGSTEFHVLRAKSTGDRLYCYFLCQTPAFRKLAERHMVGSAGQKRVSADFFRFYKINAPTPENREALGEKMFDIDQSLKRAKQNAVNSKAFQKSLINQIF